MVRMANVGDVISGNPKARRAGHGSLLYGHPIYNMTSPVSTAIAAGNNENERKCREALFTGAGAMGRRRRALVRRALERIRQRFPDSGAASGRGQVRRIAA